MKIYLYFFLFLFLNCQSQIAGNNAALQKKEIQFEDQYHYPFTLTKKSFLIISSQDKMDEVFTRIHKNNTGNRFSPIPAVVENETYIIIKPLLKNSNDILIDTIHLDKNILYVKISEFDNPDLSKTNRTSPNILLKLNGNITFNKVIIKY
ncbi:hypothetical protein SAMN05443633_103225 [Chryseobacterium arachidis]|uniref:Uncharacterized protein n=1 Tax=Chryseobacterium arachidis TaxID=1416778 RepID=A0A1M4ZPY4_9FLAO|nr:hypothetical protein [Chryseobacterium arachidis]SHF19872.1 hypothetical protein SAMN05443633_103225 [Chryseobacterium arachidis]